VLELFSVDEPVHGRCTAYANVRESFANQDRANVKGSRTIFMPLQSRGLLRCFQSFLHLLDLRHQLLFGGSAFCDPGKRLERRENCFQNVLHKRDRLP
jgi:hypothetical protein